MVQIYQIAVIARLMLREYLRSGRILVEIIGIAVAVWLFLWPNGAIKALDPVLFFGISSVIMFFLAAYSSFAISRAGRHPAAYLLLSRQPGRHGYLLGLFAAISIIILIAYTELCLLVMLIWFFHSGTISLQSWLFGSVPLLVNTLIVATFVLLITPLVMSNRPRLIMLALLVIMVSREADLFGPGTQTSSLAPLLSLMRAPLLPVVGGVALATQQTSAEGAWLLIASQLGLCAMILIGAVWAFMRRELILQE